MSMEVVELIWQNVSIWDEIVLISSKSFLHLHIIVAEPVLSCDFVALREVIDPLKLIESFVKVTLT